jgi:hypothetical protein
MFLGSKEEGTQFWTELLQAVPEFNLLSVRTQFSFLLFFCHFKYLNCGVFSEDIFAIQVT